MFVLLPVEGRPESYHFITHGELASIGPKVNGDIAFVSPQSRVDHHRNDDCDVCDASTPNLDAIIEEMEARMSAPQFKGM